MQFDIHDNHRGNTEMAAQLRNLGVETAIGAVVIYA